MVAAAERHCKLVANFKSKSAGLGKSKMVRICWLPSANKARLRAYELEMCFVAKALGLAES